MLDATAKRLLGLLEPGYPLDLRQAAAKVLGEIGTREGPVATVLCQALGDPDHDLRLQVMGAIGRLKIDQALPQLLSRVQEGGTEADAAAHALARLGPKGTRALKDLMSKVAPGLR